MKVKKKSNILVVFQLLNTHKRDNIKRQMTLKTQKRENKNANDLKNTQKRAVRYLNSWLIRPRQSL